MIGDVALFVFSLFDVGSLLFLTVYVFCCMLCFISKRSLIEIYVVTLSDLEWDYLNAQQCCSKLNKWIVPEIIFQGLVTLLLLIEWHWILFFINLPMTIWQIHKKVKVPSGNFGIYDPTEIHNRGNLKKHMRDSAIRLAFYLIFFFVYLYCMIIALLTKSPSSSGSSDEF